MTRILIIGANGQIARVATTLFLQHPDVKITLFLRRAKQLKGLPAGRVTIIEGDALNEKDLESAMAGQDVVYANLAGALKSMAQNIVKAMHVSGIKRLIFISSMGIYDEIPGERHGSILDPYREATAIFEASDLDYTILRPAWLNDQNEIAYGTTQKGEPFKAASESVSRKSVADLVVRLAMTPGLESRHSLGIHHA
jgi:uncharacterized protein YbjT (DUF2867 family)